MRKSKILLMTIVALFFSTQGVLSYSSATKINTANANGQSTSNFDTFDTKVRLNASAEYCVNPGHETGTYQFQILIFNPKGQLAYTHTDSKRNFPSQGQLVTLSKEIDTTEFSSGLGIYKVKVIYTEEYSGQTTVDAAEKKILFNGKSGSGQIQRTELLQPTDGESVLDATPFFKWDPPHPTMNLTYTMWISEDKNPLHNYFYVARNLEEFTHDYPLSAKALKVGKTYYWQVRAFDENNQPVGGTDGYSKISKFELSKSLLEEISLRFPVEEEVNQAEVDFSYDAENVSFFRVKISKDAEGKEPIWVTDSENKAVIVPIESVIGNIPQSTFYWQVEGFDAFDELKAASKVTSFTIGPMAKESRSAAELRGESGIKGTVRNLFNERLDKVYIVIAKDLDGLTDQANNKERTMAAMFGDTQKINGEDIKVTAGAITMLSETDGTYSSPIKPGEYQVAIYKDNYMLYTKKVEIKEGKYLRLDAFLIPVFGSVEGNVVDLDDGTPVGGVTVGFRASYNYQEVVTSETGSYEIPKLVNGKYTIEVFKDPHYKEIIQPNFEVKGNRSVRNFRIERIKAGQLLGNVFTKNNEPVAQAEVSVLPLNVNGAITTGRLDGNMATQNDGAFAIRDLRIGLFKVICRAPGFPEVSKIVKIESGQTTNVDFDLNDIQWKVTGRVEDADRNPIQFARISTESVEGIEPVYTDNNGNFELLLKNGEYSLQVYKAGKSIRHKTVEVDNDHFDAGTFQLVNSYSYLHVQVQSQGQALTNYKVRLTPGNIEIEADDSGFITGHRITGDTEYKIEVLLENEDFGVKPFYYYMQGGKNEHFNLEARAFMNLTGKVVNSSGAGISEATVTSQNSGEKVKTDSNGNFTFRMVTPPEGVTFELSANHFKYQENTLSTSKKSDNEISLISQEEILSQLVFNDYKKKLEDIDEKQMKTASEFVKRSNDLKSRFDDFIGSNKEFSALSQKNSALSGSLDTVESLTSNISLSNLDAAMVELEKANGLQLESQKGLNAYNSTDYKALNTLKKDSVKISVEKTGSITYQADISDVRRQFNADSALVASDRAALEKLSNETSDKISAALVDTFSVSDKVTNDIESEVVKADNLRRDVQENIDRYFELSNQLLAAMASLGLPEDDYRFQLIELQKEKLAYRQKVSIVIKGLQGLIENQNQTSLLFIELQSRLRGAHKKLQAFEDDANNRLGEANKFIDRLGTVQDSLRINKFGGFDAQITVKPKEGSKNMMQLHGYLTAKNNILDEVDIELLDAEGNKLELNLINAVPKNLSVAFEDGFSTRRILRDDLAKLVNEEGWVDVVSKLEGSDFYQDEKYLDNKIQENHHYLNNIESVINDLEKEALFTAELESISVNNITPAQKSELVSEGARNFMVKHALPGAPFIMQVNTISLATYTVDSFKEKWPQYTFKSQYGMFAGKAPSEALANLLGNENRDHIPDPIDSGTDGALIKTFIPRKLQPFVRESLSVEDYDLTEVDYFAKFSLQEFQKSLQEDLASMVITEPIPVRGDVDFAYKNIPGNITAVMLDFEKGRNQAVLEADINLNLETVSEDLYGIGVVKSEKPVEMFPDTDSIAQVKLVPLDESNDFTDPYRQKDEPWPAIKIHGYQAYLKTLLIDFKRDHLVSNGRIFFQKIDRSLEFQRGTFDGNQDWDLVKVSFPMDRYLKYKYAGLTLALTAAHFDQEGIKLSGTIALPDPVNKTIRIDQVILDSNGDTLSNNIQAFEANYFGGKLVTSGGGLVHTQYTEEEYLYALENDLYLSDEGYFTIELNNCGLHLQLDANKIPFDIGRCRFSVYDNGGPYPVLDFQLDDIATIIQGKETNFEFANFKFGLKNITYGEDYEAFMEMAVLNDQTDVIEDHMEPEQRVHFGMKYIRIEADVDLTIPGAGVNAAGFTIYENGSFKVDPIHFYVDQGFMMVRGVALYENNKLFGAATAYLNLGVNSKPRQEMNNEAAKLEAAGDTTGAWALEKLKASNDMIRLDLNLELYDEERWKMNFDSDTILSFNSFSIKDLEGGIVAAGDALKPRIRGNYMVADATGFSFGLFKGFGSIELDISVQEPDPNLKGTLTTEAGGKMFRVEKINLTGSYETTPGKAALSALINFSMAAMSSMSIKNAGILDKLSWAYYGIQAAIQIFAAIEPIEMRVEVDAANDYTVNGVADIASLELSKDYLKIAGRMQIYMVPEIKDDPNKGKVIDGIKAWGIGAIAGINLSLGMPLSESDEKYTFTGMGMAFGYNMPVDFEIHDGLTTVPNKVYGLMMFQSTGLAIRMGGFATVRMNAGSWTYYHMPALADATISSGGSLVTVIIAAGFAGAIWNSMGAIAMKGFGKNLTMGGLASGAVRTVKTKSLRTFKNVPFGTSGNMAKSFKVWKKANPKGNFAQFQAGVARRGTEASMIAKAAAAQKKVLHKAFKKANPKGSVKDFNRSLSNVQREAQAIGNHFKKMDNALLKFTKAQGQNAKAAQAASFAAKYPKIVQGYRVSKYTLLFPWKSVKAIYKLAKKPLSGPLKSFWKAQKALRSGALGKAIKKFKFKHPKAASKMGMGKLSKADAAAMKVANMIKKSKAQSQNIGMLAKTKNAVKGAPMGAYNKVMGKAEWAHYSGAALNYQVARSALNLGRASGMMFYGNEMMCYVNMSRCNEDALAESAEQGHGASRIEDTFKKMGDDFVKVGESFGASLGACDESNDTCQSTGDALKNTGYGMGKYLNIQGETVIGISFDMGGELAGAVTFNSGMYAFGRFRIKGCVDWIPGLCVDFDQDVEIGIAKGEDGGGIRGGNGFKKPPENPPRILESDFVVGAEYATEAEALAAYQQAVADREVEIQRLADEYAEQQHNRAKYPWEDEDYTRYKAEDVPPEEVSLLGFIRDQDLRNADTILKIYEPKSEADFNFLKQTTSNNEAEFEKRCNLVHETQSVDGAYYVASKKDTEDVDGDGDKEEEIRILEYNKVYFLVASLDTPDLAFMPFVEHVTMNQQIVEKNLFVRYVDKRPREFEVKVISRIDKKPLTDVTVSWKPAHSLEPSVSGIEDSLENAGELFTTRDGIAKLNLLANVDYNLTVTGPGITTKVETVTIDYQDRKTYALVIEVDVNPVPVTIPLHVNGEIKSNERVSNVDMLFELCRDLRASMRGPDKTYEGKIVCDIATWDFSEERAPIWITFKDVEEDSDKTVDYDVVIEGHDKVAGLNSLPLTIQGTNIKYRGNRTSELTSGEKLYFMIEKEDTVSEEVVKEKSDVETKDIKVKQETTSKDLDTVGDASKIGKTIAKTENE